MSLKAPLYKIVLERSASFQHYYLMQVYPPVPLTVTDIFNLCFDTGFVIDGFYEECYFNKEIPDIIIVRAIKIER